MHVHSKSYSCINQKPVKKAILIGAFGQILKVIKEAGIVKHANMPAEQNRDD